MKFKRILILGIVLLLFGAGINSALAFGISPPRVFNDHLIPGARFEQIITLTQAQPEQPLRIEVEITAPEIKDWIKIEPGLDFVIPAGKQQFPMRVTVNVPKDAGYDTYEGEISITAIPTSGGGQVAILAGAVADIKIRVSGEEFSDFRLKNMNVSNIEEGMPIKVTMRLENLGNVKVRPSKIYLRIYDQYHQNLLQEGEAENITWAEPFKTENVIANLPTKIGVGEYWAEVEVYKNDEELILKDKRYFKIVERGTLSFILGLSRWIWALIIGIILSGFLIVRFKLLGKLLKRLGIVIKIEKTKK